MATITTAGQPEKTLTSLNSLLRGEISAVETYRQALGKSKLVAQHIRFAECVHSHELRVTKLRDRVIALGGTPADSSGAWGTFSKIIQTGADALGEKAAVTALEEGEDHGLAEYQKAMSEVDAESRDLIEQELLPAQMRTHRAMSTLKHALQ
jgi:uncharacterized protein (TIGR02284 family)